MTLKIAVLPGDGTGPEVVAESLKVLDAIERQGYDVLSRRPTLSRAAKVRLMLSTTLRLKLLGRP